MSLIHVNSENQASLFSKELVLLDFYADWCGPCRMLAPTLEELAAEHGEITVAKVNVDENPSLAAQYGISVIPTLVVLKNGTLVKQDVGVKSKEELLCLLQG